ncbi:hypothetical protein EJD97_021703, partial [Solanum chilense]
ILACWEHKTVIDNHSRSIHGLEHIIIVWNFATGLRRKLNMLKCLNIYDNFLKGLKLRRKDEYGLPRVYFNKLCSTEDQFVLASQVHQIFYVEDPIEKDVYYSNSKVNVDLFGLEEDQNCPNIGDTFLRDPNNDIRSKNAISHVPGYVI